MNTKKQTGSLVARWRSHAWLLGLVWTGCIAASLLWNLSEQEDRSRAMARSSARITFENDVLYRHWLAEQGGIYVRVSPQVPPNPYLKVAERDVTTTSGLSLTLVNPAYMARMVNQAAAAAGGSRGHITSLKPLRPENAPDTWEATALRSFADGVQEVSSVERMADGEYLRLIRPFVAEQACLKCHADQGYQAGDVLGGVCVSVPMAPLRAIENHVMGNLLLAHAGLWCLGLGGIVVSSRALGRREDRIRLLSTVTAELLASDQPQRTIEAICRRVMDHLGCQVFVNFLVDEQTNRLQLNAFAGISEEMARQIECLDYGTAVCGCVARDGRPIVAEHIQTTPDPRTSLVRSFGVQAYACHPLINQGQTIGTLSFGSRVKPTFTAEELGLMKAVADHVAIAMQRIRLLESLERNVRAAEAANAAKTQFLANMSHELRTPMNAILGMIDVALPKATDPTVRDCLQTAKGSAGLLLTLLNDLLDSAKIESGKLELESAPFSLRQMLDHVTRVLSLRASEKGLRFDCRMPAGTPDAVLGDRTRLQQVLLNLAGNAIKFTERGSVEIGLRVSPRPLAGEGPGVRAAEKSLDPEPLPEGAGDVLLEFAVRDTGIGISLSAQEHLFEPFAQADASTTRRFGGTGLGLSICKRLVEAMDGRIWVESAVGQGTTFHFTVRLPWAQEPPADSEASAVVPMAARPLRILLAEDNRANQKVATYILQERGHQVEIAGDGRKAIALTRQKRYDVILMDVQMPEMDGLEATAVIRAAEQVAAEKGSGLVCGNGPEGASHKLDPTPFPPPPLVPPPPPRVPIIAMTAHALPEDRQRCLAAGMDGYLAKPIDAPALIALVEELAAGARSLSAAANALPKR